MNGAQHTHRLCPRCYASLAADSRGCSRCGATLPAAADTQTAGDLAAAGRIWTQTPLPAAEAAPYCPRCDRLELPGGRFTGALAHGSAGACPHCGTAMVTAPSGTGLSYEEVSLAAESWDLDRLVRAEAVDGWTLVDTTIDPSSPQRLLAHFRRPLGEGAAPSGAQSTPASQPAPAARSARPTAPAEPLAPSRPLEPSAPAAPRSSGAGPIDARSAKAAAKEARRAAKEAQRAARWERRRLHWEERLERALAAGKPSTGEWPAGGAARRSWRGGRHHPAAILAMVVTVVVTLSLTVAAQLLRHLVLPLALGLAMALRQALLSMFWGITGPGPHRRSQRR